METSPKHRHVDYDSIATVFSCVIPCIHTTADRNSISILSHQFHTLDSLTRHHITIPICYATSPSHLHHRFPNLESLTLKGKPNAPIFDPVPSNWGGYITPWIISITQQNLFIRIKSLCFKRMLVNDTNLITLAETRGKCITDLTLYQCSGFSTDGLLHIGKKCSNLKRFSLEKSFVVAKDGEWLHELALGCKCIESLNFYKTNIDEFDYKDLVLLAKNCGESLVSVKITECRLVDLADVFRYAVKLEEFAGAMFRDEDEDLTDVKFKFPPKVRCLGMTVMSKNDLPVVVSFANQITELDLTYARLDKDAHSILMYKCPNLQVLNTKDSIGDYGLEVIGCFCKKLRRIKIESVPSREGLVSQAGIVALVYGCRELECLHVYVKDITNKALECIGDYSKKLLDFRVISVYVEGRMTDLPLDNGVKALLSGCTKLRKLGIYLRPGALTDTGLGYIGEYGQNLKSLLLGYIGENDGGIVELSKGCPNLQKFQMRGCYIRENAVADFVLNSTSLRYLWVQGHRFRFSGCRGVISENGGDVSENGGGIPENGGDVPEIGGGISENGGDVPEIGGGIAENGGDVPEIGGGISENGGDIAENGGDIAEDGGDVPEIGGGISENGGDIAEDGGDISEDGGDTSESGDDISESRSDVSESGGDISESDDDSIDIGGDIFGGGGDIFEMIRPFWNMELTGVGESPEFIRPADVVSEATQETFLIEPFSLLAYYSLVGQRTDFPDSVTLL